MSADIKDKFFVALQYKHEKLMSYSVSSKEPSKEIGVGENIATEEPPRAPTFTMDLSFQSVFNDFRNVMDMHFGFVPLLLSMNSVIISSLADDRIKKIVEKKGNLLDDLSSKEILIYELDSDHIRQFGIHDEETEVVFAWI
jgi:hypothetical protein